EMAVGGEALPERALDGRGRDVVLAPAEHERGAGEGARELEGVAGPVAGLGLVAHRRIVEDDGTQLPIVGGEGDEESATHAVTDGARALRIGRHAVDQVAPRLFHLAEELRV